MLKELISYIVISITKDKEYQKQLYEFFSKVPIDRLINYACEFTDLTKQQVIKQYNIQ